MPIQLCYKIGYCNLPSPWNLHSISICLVRETGLEPVQENSRYPLKVVRLPVPPLSHIKAVEFVKFF